MNPSQLAERAAYFRQIADRMDALSQKRAELDKEEQELASFMGGQAFVSIPPPPPPQPVITLDIDIPNTEGLGLLKKREQFIMTFLKKWIRLKRGQIFELLQKVGIAPKDADQLSVLLSKMRKDGIIDQDDNGFWFDPSQDGVVSPS